MKFIRVRMLAENVFDLTFQLAGAEKSNSGILKTGPDGSVLTFTPGPHCGRAPEFTREGMESLFNWKPPEGLERGVEYEYPT